MQALYLVACMSIGYAVALYGSNNPSLWAEPSSMTLSVDEGAHHGPLLTFISSKLVRGRTPERLYKRGVACHARVLDYVEYDRALRRKLVEEAREAEAATSDEELFSELIDVLEVIHALCRVHHIDIEDLEAERQRVQVERGSFDNRTYCTHVELPADNPYVAYYRSQPHKYLEIQG